MQWHLTPVLLLGKSHGRRSPVGCSPWGRKSRTRLSDFTFTFPFHALEEEMATHSSVLAWRIPGTGEPGGLPSIGLHRVGHDWSNLAAAVCYMWAGWLLIGLTLKSGYGCQSMGSRMNDESWAEFHFIHSKVTGHTKALSDFWKKCPSLTNNKAIIVQPDYISRKGPKH